MYKPFQLKDLPLFRIKGIRSEDSVYILDGVFNRLSGVREGRSWLYISAAESLLGDLEAIDPRGRSASFRVGSGDPEEHAPVGANLPWIDGYWNVSLIARILAPSSGWHRTEFINADAIETSQNGVRKWRKAESGEPVSEGASLVSEGWDHEHCEICQTKIEERLNSIGFVSGDEVWLCETCFHRHALRHDLSFLGDP
jgi:hypothetical protein